MSQWGSYVDGCPCLECQRYRAEQGRAWLTLGTVLVVVAAAIGGFELLRLVVFGAL